MYFTFNIFLLSSFPVNSTVLISPQGNIVREKGLEIELEQHDNERRNKSSLYTLSQIQPKIFAQFGSITQMHQEKGAARSLIV